MYPPGLLRQHRQPIAVSVDQLRRAMRLLKDELHVDLRVGPSDVSPFVVVHFGCCLKRANCQRHYGELDNPLAYANHPSGTHFEYLGFLLWEGEINPEGEWELLSGKGIAYPPLYSIFNVFYLENALREQALVVKCLFFNGTGELIQICICYASQRILGDEVFVRLG